MRKISILFIGMVLASVFAIAQDFKWPEGQRAAVIFTYDDGLDEQLDFVIPQLDSLGLKGTFYIYAKSETICSRYNEWREAAEEGHELGNHSLFHPCKKYINGDDRKWVDTVYDLDNYSFKRLEDELITANCMLRFIDNKENRTYAYTCTETSIGDSSFIQLIKKYFSGGRIGGNTVPNINDLNVYLIPSIICNGQSYEELLGYVEEACNQNSVVVFLFHGVGGGHSLNIDLGVHRKLLNYVKDNSDKIWNPTFIEFVEYYTRNSND